MLGVQSIEHRHLQANQWYRQLLKTIDHNIDQPPTAIINDEWEREFKLDKMIDLSHATMIPWLLLLT
jgi:hypothetical protein